MPSNELTLCFDVFPLTKPQTKLTILQTKRVESNDRLVLYPTKRFKRAFPYLWILNYLIDPYSDPER